MHPTKNKQPEQNIKADMVYDVLCFIQDAAQAMAETEEQHGGSITARGLNGLGAVIHRFKADLKPVEK